MTSPVVTATVALISFTANGVTAAHLGAREEIDRDLRCCQTKPLASLPRRAEQRQRHEVVVLIGRDMRGQEDALAPSALGEPFDRRLTASNLDLLAVQRFKDKAVEIAKSVVEERLHFAGVADRDRRLDLSIAADRAQEGGSQ